MTGCCCSLVFLVTALASSGGENIVSSDWPQFQGPNRNGISPETGLATTWPDTGPPVLWEAALGVGYAGPAVRGDNVFLLDRKGDTQDILRCFELQTGIEIFAIPCDARGSTPYDGSRMPVTVNNGRVYGVGLMGDCYCFDVGTRTLVWRRNLPADFKIDLTRPNESCWGMAQCPLLYCDLLIVGLQCADRSMAALNPETGDTIWTAEQLGYQDYTMPTVATLGGVEQLVMSGGAKAHARAAPSGTIAGISPQDGTTLWSVKEVWKCWTPVSPAVALSDDRFILTGGYDAGTAMLQVKREGDGFTVKELWHQEQCGSHIQMPIAFDGYLYENTCENHHNNGMVCLSLDNGEIMWRTKGSKGDRRFERGPMLLVDGMILNLSDVTGVLCLIKPSPKGYTELAAAKVLAGNQLWGYMAFSQGRLLLRNLTHMKCLDLRACETVKKGPDSPAKETGSK